MPGPRCLARDSKKCFIIIETQRKVGESFEDGAVICEHSTGKRFLSVLVNTLVI